MLWIVLLLGFMISGCGPMTTALEAPGQPSAKVASTTGQSIDEVQLEPYDGPKARVAVYRFTDRSAKGHGGYSRRTGWYTAEIGTGMADMLNDALLQSNRYIVLERQALKDVLTEQDLGASGRVKRPTAAPIGEIEGADLLIKGSITEFEPGSSGAGGGGALGAFGLPGAVIGGALGSVRQSHIAMIVQVTDATTSRLLFSTTVEGSANDFDLGGFFGGFGGTVGGGAGLGVYQNTPMEKAIRIAILKAVQELSKKTPNTYFRYGAGAWVATPAPSSVAKASSQAPAKGSSAQVISVSPHPSAPEQVSNLPSTVTVKVKSANLRDAPGTQSKVVNSITRGVKLNVQAEEKEWYMVQTSDGKQGWIAKSLTEP